jgi:hypothetical protein
MDVVLLLDVGLLVVDEHYHLAVLVLALIASVVPVAVES